MKRDMRFRMGFRAFHAVILFSAFAALSNVCAIADGSGPPGIPKGGIETGRGVDLGSPSLADGRLGKDANGETVVYVKWIAWRLYMLPTDNVDVQLIFNCWQHCLKGIHGHVHSSACSLHSCCQQDDNLEHKGEISSSSKQEFESNLAEALKVTTKVTDKMTSELHAGFEKGGVKVGGSVKREQTWSEETVGKINKSVREMFGRSNTGAISIRTGHFCLKPCSERQRGYGTRDWEVHLVWQIFEQPYKPQNGWVEGVGGVGGILPNGALKLAGEPHWLGDPKDELLGTIKIPSDAPLFERPVPYKCPCDNSVETPGGGNTPDNAGGSDDKHSLRPPDPTGTQAVVNVEVTPAQHVVINNPYNVPLTVTNQETNAAVIVEPQNKKAMDKSWRTLTVAAGAAALYSLISNAPGGPAAVVSPPDNADNLAPSNPADRPVKLSGKTVAEAPQPFNGPVEFPAVEKTGIYVEHGGIRTNKLPGGSVSPIVKIAGFPAGAVVDIQQTAGSSSPAPTSATLASVEGPDGKASQFVMQITAPVPGNDIGKAILSCASSSGAVIMEQEVQFTRADIRTTMQPASGAPGSPATLVVDYREWLRAMQLERPGFTADRYELALDFSKTGGARGPAAFPIEAGGTSRIRITRGSIAGSFPLAIQVMAKK